MTALTLSVGQFIAELSPHRIPAEAMRIARLGFIDCIGTMIAGRNEDAVGIMRSTLAPPPGPSSITFSAARAPAPEAAWINGVAAHALDYDDVALRGHPSTVLVPAILAEAEALDASGLEMLVAYVAGYETWAEMFRRDSGLLHKKGWHPTGLYGAVGAAAACAKLRRLDARKAAIAVALGASQSAGLMANFGTMTKPFHAGRSAHAGIMAARLADAGFTAATDALEHPQGFLHAISPDGTEDRTDGDRLGETWALLTQGLGIKKYPTCYCTHRAIDGMLDLMAAHPVRADDVKQITVKISDYFATVLRNHAPDTGLAAKFSIEFAMASGRRPGTAAPGAHRDHDGIRPGTARRRLRRSGDGGNHRRAGAGGREGGPRHRPRDPAAVGGADLRQIRRLPGGRRHRHPRRHAVRAADGAGGHRGARSGAGLKASLHSSGRCHGGGETRRARDGQAARRATRSAPRLTRRTLTVRRSDPSTSAASSSVASTAISTCIVASERWDHMRSGVRPCRAKGSSTRGSRPGSASASRKKRTCARGAALAARGDDMGRGTPETTCAKRTSQGPGC
jgi:2-methylcitrate dehydratase PrpD